MGEGKKLLLVDDEQDFLDIMAKFLSRRGLPFVTANGCMVALDILGTENIDVIIMDVSMPGMDGIQCLQEVKRVHPAIEVIVLTGQASPKAGITGMKMGAFDYCLKPVDFDNLVEKITLARGKAAGTR
jgi:two-component system OmpR family response regulator